MIDGSSQPIIHFDNEKGIKYVNNIPFLEQSDIEYLKKMIPQVEKLAQECRELRESNEQEIHKLKHNVTELQKKIEEIDKDVKQTMIITQENRQKIIQFLNETKDKIIQINKDIDNEREKYYLERKMKNEEDYIKITALLKECDDQDQSVRKQINDTKFFLQKRRLFRLVGIGVIIHFGALLIFHALLWAKNETGKIFLIAFKGVNLTRFKSNHPEI